MLTKILICVGMIVTPFIINTEFGLRDPKMWAAGIVSLLTFLSVLLCGNSIKCNTKSAILMLAYIPFSTVFGVKFFGYLNHARVNTPWAYESFTYILLFSLLFFVVSSIRLSNKDVDRFKDLCVLVASVCSAYMIIQRLGYDPLFNLINVHIVGGKCVGFFGQPVIAGTFIAMSAPMAIKRRHFIVAAVIIAAVILSKSQMAIGSMAVSLLFYFMCNSRKDVMKFIVICAVSLVALGFVYTKDKGHAYIEDSGRFKEWSYIVQHLNKPVFVGNEKTAFIFGTGSGSFRYVHRPAEEDRVEHVHNEYIEVLKELGVVGCAIMLFMLFEIFILFDYARHKDISSAVVCSLLSACGFYVFHLGAHMFYIACFIGLLNNSLLSKDKAGVYANG